MVFVVGLWRFHHPSDVCAGGSPFGLETRNFFIRLLSAPSLGSNFSIAIAYLLGKVLTSGILNQKKTAPEAVVHAFSTAVFLWVGWFISGYGTPVSKTVQGLFLDDSPLPSNPLWPQKSQRDFC